MVNALNQFESSTKKHGKKIYSKKVEDWVMKCRGDVISGDGEENEVAERNKKIKCYLNYWTIKLKRSNE